MELAVDVSAGHGEAVGGVAHQARDLDAAMLRNCVKDLVSAVFRFIHVRPVAR